MWKASFIQIIDYIANPRILKKNLMIVAELTEKYLPELDQNLLEQIIEHLKNHSRDCYDLISAMDGEVKDTDKIYLDFNDEKEQIDEK